MKTEIKEILNLIECWKNGDYVLAYSFNYDKASKQNDKILDYITNLQEENESLKGIAELRKDTLIMNQKKVDKLQEERKTLYRYTPEKGFELVGDEE